MSRRTRTKTIVASSCVGCVAAAVLAMAFPTAAAADPVPLSTFGSVGSGAGQLDDPTRLAIDGAGRVYVVDFSNNRISVFGADGSFIHAFGSDVAEPDGGTAFEVCPAQGACQAGENTSVGGGFSSPYDLAFDGAGNLYVSSIGNDRIDVFDPAGPSFTRAFGWDVAEPDGTAAFEVCPAQGACRAGDNAGNGGALTGAAGLAHDGASSLYVADSGNHRISVFNTAGPSFTRAFGADVAEPNGGAAFEVCPAQGACRAGDLGGGAGQLRFPDGIALDGTGSLYIADLGNQRISVFGTAGPTFTRAFGRDVADPDGGTAFEVCPTQGACRQGDGAGTDGALNSPLGIDFDGAGGLYVADQLNQRISVFGTGGTFTRAFGFDVAEPLGPILAYEVCPTQGACRVGDLGFAAGQFAFPQGVAADCRGAAWVADTGNDRVQRLGEPGTALPPCPVTAPPPPPPGPAGGSVVTAPLAVPENPKCATLRAKLKKAKSKKRKRRIRKQLRKLGC